MLDVNTIDIELTFQTRYNLLPYHTWVLYRFSYIKCSPITFLLVEKLFTYKKGELKNLISRKSWKKLSILKNIHSCLKYSIRFFTYGTPIMVGLLHQYCLFLMFVEINFVLLFAVFMFGRSSSSWRMWKKMKI